jgi:hypothetical protein
MQVEKYNFVTSIISITIASNDYVKFFKMAKEISKVVKLQVREVLRTVATGWTCFSWVNIMDSVSNLMLELKINLAKYAQYKLLCIKTNHLILL